MQRPTISGLWSTTSVIPFGNRLFSRLVGQIAPYTGTMGATVLELGPGHSKTELRDRRGVRNHLSSIHAVALANLGELTTGLAVMHAVDGRGRGIVKRLSIEYVKKARGTITGSCDIAIPEGPGSFDLTVPGELRDASGDVVARIEAVWKLEINGR